jgi:hypothetical protein
MTESIGYATRIDFIQRADSPVMIGLAKEHIILLMRANENIVLHSRFVNTIIDFIVYLSKKGTWSEEVSRFV